MNLSKGSNPKKTLPVGKKNFAKKLLMKAVVGSKICEFVSDVAFLLFVQFRRKVSQDYPGPRRI